MKTIMNYSKSYDVQLCAWIGREFFYITINYTNFFGLLIDMSTIKGRFVPTWGKKLESCNYR